MNQVTNHPGEIRVVVEQRPVEPASFVVLRVGIVVTELRMAEFISSEQQWYTLGDQQGGEHIQPLLAAQGGDMRVVGRAFDAIVTAVVVRVAATSFLP